MKAGQAEPSGRAIERGGAAMKGQAEPSGRAIERGGAA
jgi:hypothetical protein